MATANFPEEAATREFLQAATGSPDSHYRFLNTLSLLEHIGSRKIMMSQCRARPEEVPAEILQHVAEETRHAWFFKRAAQTAAQKPLGYRTDEVLAGAAAQRYFQKIDAFVTRAVGEEAAYPYVSLVVELRAVWFYRIYEQVLSQSGQGPRLHALMAEEDRHLEDLSEKLRDSGEQAEKRLPVLTEFELRCFLKMLGSLRSSLNCRIAT